MIEVEGAAAGNAAASGNLLMHARTQIRNAAATILKQETAAWALVYQSRIDYPRDVWPYLKIYADREDVQRLSIHSPHSQQRTLSLIVVAMIRIPSAGETETVEDKMDSLGSLIEGLLTDEALAAELSQYNLIIDLLSSDMAVVLNTDEKISHAELTLNYKIVYQTMEGLPDEFI